MNDTKRKLSVGIITIIVLSLCLFITTFAIVWENLSLDNSLFNTGLVDINLNDGRPVIDEHEFVFEPGMQVSKSFFIENESTCDVYYKLYFENIQGGLADVLEVQIDDGDHMLFSGKVDNIVSDEITAADDLLAPNERKEMTINFYFPETAQNEYQNQALTFDFCAQAVQAKNNPGKEFN